MNSILMNILRAMLINQEAADALSRFISIHESGSELFLSRNYPVMKLVSNRLETGMVIRKQLLGDRAYINFGDKQYKMNFLLTIKCRQYINQVLLDTHSQNVDSVLTSHYQSQQLITTTPLTNSIPEEPALINVGVVELEKKILKPKKDKGINLGDHLGDNILFKCFDGTLRYGRVIDKNSSSTYEYSILGISYNKKGCCVIGQDRSIKKIIKTHRVNYNFEISDHLGDEVMILLKNGMVFSGVFSSINTQYAYELYCKWGNGEYDTVTFTKDGRYIINQESRLDIAAIIT